MTTQHNDQADHVEATAAETPTRLDLSRVAATEDEGARETRPIPAVEVAGAEASVASLEPTDAPVATADGEEEDDSGATVAQEAVRPTPAATRPRKTTLAVAINRQTTGPRAES
ncbi:MAG: hypothetical protein ACRDHE_17045, partial [Ktedonobacterales bacterium]